ncbi:MAG: hypothetical protein IJO43_01520 [Bacilli bacterium]|nr:hypothetical protein [Bacilli bacterium]
MNKDLPSIFKNPCDRKIENNKKVFYSKYESVGNIEERVKEDSSKFNVIDLDDAITYNEALNNLFKNNQFVFNVPVEIITKEVTYNTKIVSKVNDHLLTNSGKIIRLDDILSINIKG